MSGLFNGNNNTVDTTSNEPSEVIVDDRPGDGLFGGGGAVNVTTGSAVPPTTNDLEFDEGTRVLTSTVDGVSDSVVLPEGGGADIVIQDEGVTLQEFAETLNFTGNAVTARGTTTTKNIDIRSLAPTWDIRNDYKTDDLAVYQSGLYRAITDIMGRIGGSPPTTTPAVAEQGTITVDNAVMVQSSGTGSPERVTLTVSGNTGTSSTRADANVNQLNTVGQVLTFDFTLDPTITGGGPGSGSAIDIDIDDDRVRFLINYNAPDTSQEFINSLRAAIGNVTLQSNDNWESTAVLSEPVANSNTFRIALTRNNVGTLTAPGRVNFSSIVIRNYVTNITNLQIEAIPSQLRITSGLVDETLSLAPDLTTQATIAADVAAKFNANLRLRAVFNEATVDSMSRVIFESRANANIEVMVSDIDNSGAIDATLTTMDGSIGDTFTMPIIRLNTPGDTARFTDIAIPASSDSDSIATLIGTSLGNNGYTTTTTNNVVSYTRDLAGAVQDISVTVQSQGDSNIANSFFTIDVTQQGADEVTLVAGSPPASPTQWQSLGGSGGGVGGITIQDDGVTIGDFATTLDFRGDGVTVSGAGANKIIDIPGNTSRTINTWPNQYSADFTVNPGDLYQIQIGLVQNLIVFESAIHAPITITSTNFDHLEPQDGHPLWTQVGADGSAKLYPTTARYSNYGMPAIRLVEGTIWQADNTVVYRFGISSATIHDEASRLLYDPVLGSRGNWVRVEYTPGELIDINGSETISVDLSEATTITSLTSPATTANSYVILDEDGQNAKISIDNFNDILPITTHNDFHVVANLAEYVALRNVEVGDWVYQTDSTILQRVTAVDGSNNNSIQSTQSLFNTTVKFLSNTPQNIVIGDIVDLEGVLYLSNGDSPARRVRDGVAPSWIQISGGGSGPSARIRVTSGSTLPASGELGDIFFNYITGLISEYRNGGWISYGISNDNLPDDVRFRNVTATGTVEFDGTVNFDGQANFVVGHPFVNAHTASQLNSTQANNDAVAVADLKRVRDQLEAEIGHGYGLIESVSAEKNTESLYTRSFELDGNTTNLFPHARRVPQTIIPPTPVNSGGNADNFLAMWASSWDEAPRYGDHTITDSQGITSHSAGAYNPHSLTNFYGNSATGPRPITVDGTSWNYDYQFVDYNFTSGTRYGINDPNISLEFNQDVSPMITAVLYRDNGATIDRMFTQAVVSLHQTTPTTSVIPAGSLVRFFQYADNSGTDDRWYEIATDIPAGALNTMHVPSDAVRRFPALTELSETPVGAPGISGVVKWEITDPLDTQAVQYLATCDTGDPVHNWGVRTRHIAGGVYTNYRLQPLATATGTSDRQYFGFRRNGTVLDFKFGGQISIPRGLTLRIRGEDIADNGTRTRKVFQFTTANATGRYESGLNETVITIPITDVFEVIGGTVQSNHYVADVSGENWFLPTDGVNSALQVATVTHYELELVSRDVVQKFESGGSPYQLDPDDTYRLGYHFWVDTSAGTDAPLQSIYVELYRWNTGTSTWDRVAPSGGSNRIDARITTLRSRFNIAGQPSTHTINYLEPTVNLGIAEGNQAANQRWINHFAFGDMVIARPKGHWDAATIGTNLQALTGDTDVFYDLLAPATTGGIELSLRPSVEFQTDQYLKTNNTLRIDYNRNWIAPHTSSADTVTFQGQNFQISREDLPGGTNYMGPSSLEDGDWFPASWPTEASGGYRPIAVGGTNINNALPAANTRLSVDTTDPFIVIHDTGSGYVDNISNHIPQGSLNSFELFWDGTSADHVAEYTDDNTLSLRTTDTRTQKVTAYAVPSGSISNVSYDLGDAVTTDPDTRKIYIPQMRTDWRTDFPIVEVVEGDAYSSVTRQGSSTVNGPGSAVLSNGSSIVFSDISNVVSASSGMLSIHALAGQGHDAYTAPGSTSVGDTVVILQGDNSTIGRRFIVARVTGNRSVGSNLVNIPISFDQVDTLFDLNGTWEIYLFSGNVDPSETPRTMYDSDDLFGRTHWIEGFFLEGRGESRFYTFGAYNTDNGLFDNLLFVDPSVSGGSTVDIPSGDRELKTDRDNGFNLEIVRHSQRLASVPEPTQPESAIPLNFDPIGIFLGVKGVPVGSDETSEEYYIPYTRRSITYYWYPNKVLNDNKGCFQNNVFTGTTPGNNQWIITLLG